jgi:hypothetical protein
MIFTLCLLTANRAPRVVTEVEAEWAITATGCLRGKRPFFPQTEISVSMLHANASLPLKVKIPGFFPVSETVGKMV